MERQFIVEQLQAALVADAQLSARALSSSVETPAEIWDHFSVTSYRKGKLALLIIYLVLYLMQN